MSELELPDGSYIGNKSSIPVGSPTPSPAAGSEELTLNDLVMILAGSAGYSSQVKDWKTFERIATEEITKFITAQNNATYAAVMELLKDDAVFDEDDPHQVTLNQARNELRADLSQSIAKIFRKEV